MSSFLLVVNPPRSSSKSTSLLTSCHIPEIIIVAAQLAKSERLVDDIQGVKFKDGKPVKQDHKKSVT